MYASCSKKPPFKMSSRRIKMTTIYVIEQLIDKKWVGIQTNFFNSIKNKSMPDKIIRALRNMPWNILQEAVLDQSEMTSLINKLSPFLPNVLPLDQYISMVFRSLPALERRRLVIDRFSALTCNNKIINMPPEFDIDKMRFLWWSGDYARTPVESREYPYP